MKLGTNTIQTTKPHSNLDAFYGPYNSVEEVYAKLKSDYRMLGLTVGILEQGGIVEYWWKKGITNEDLEPKLIGTGLDDIDFTVKSYPNNSVEITYYPLGSSIFSQNSVNLYRNNTLLVSANFNQDGQTFRFENVQPGQYTYKIQITDIFGQSMTKDTVVTVGVLKITTENLQNITGLQKITSSTIVEKQFKVNIQILNSDWQDAEFGIFADETKISSLQFTNDSNYKRITVNITPELAQQMDGHTVYVKSKLNGDEYKYELFKVLGSDVLFVDVNGTLPKFYHNTIVPLRLKFTSGANSFYIQSDENSDFSFNSQTITFNQLGVANISIYVTPNLVKPNSQIVFLYGDNKTVSLELGEILEEPTSERYISWDQNFPTNSNTSSCYIDFTGIIIPNREENPETINNSNVIIRFNNRMYITNDVIHVNDIEIATPLNEKIYVGLGFGLQDINPNRPIIQGEDASSGYYTYDCICINGTIVKISSLERQNIQLTWGSQIPSSKYLDIQKKGNKLCQGYWQGNPSLNLFNNQNVPLCEINYLEDGFGEDENNKVIPTLYLEVIDSPEPDSYTVWKSGFHNVSFGTVFDGADKYGNSIPADSQFKLVKIDEPLKKKCQKYYGVVCHYYYTNTNNELPNNISEIQNNPDWSDGIVTVYTQGTSTLRYSIPNFKFYFKQDFTLKYGDNESINEKILTAKADYMESSHLNNTPTAMLYNKIVKSDIINDKSPSASLNNSNYNDAIVGSPVKLMIKDRNSNVYNNFGSFMLNTDKTSDTLGFKLNNSLENENDITCISYEGTSNDEGSGQASRYIITNSVKNSFDSIYDLITTNGEDGSWYCDKVNNKKGYAIIKYTVDSNLNKTFVNQEKSNTYEHIVTVLNYLSDGLEYRYPDSTIIEEKDPEEGSNVYSYTIMPYEHFVQLFTMFYKIANIDTLNTDIGEIFNLEYCYLYIIFMIVFGQTDNLGKNCMFDCWKENGTWGKWFPRPYDLDSQCGINNNGQEIIPPFVQISRNWVPDESLKNSNIFDDSNKFVYKYMPQAKIFGYSSATSKLWETIFIQYQDNINSMYSDLRANYFNYDNLENHFKDIIIDKISIHQYNIDFLNKYLGSVQQQYMLGNRWTNFRDWLKMRLAFCDGFFQYKKVTYQISGQQNFNVKYIFPAYAIVNYGAKKRYFFGEDIDKDYSENPQGDPIIIGGTAATQPDIFLSDSLVLSTSLYDNSDYTTSFNDVFAFQNLQTLTLGGAISPDLTKCKLLSTLIITSDCSIRDFIIPSNVQILNCSAPINSISIDENSQLTTIILKNANLGENENLNLTNCSKLQNLILDSCTIKGQVMLGSGKYNFSSNNCTFNTITLDRDSEIDDLDLSNQKIFNLNLSGKLKRLDLFNTQFTNNTVEYKDLDLTNVSGISILNLIGCNINRVKIGNNTFKTKTGEDVETGEDIYSENTLKLGLQDSNISIFGKTDQNDQFVYDGFDLTVLPENVTSILNYNNSSSDPISSIYSLSYDKDNKTYSGRSTSTSSNTSMNQNYVSLGKLSNLIKVKVKSEIYGTALFAQCNNLTTVEYIKAKSNDPDKAKIYSDWVFYGCNKLSTITNIQIGKFMKAFIGTTLPYSTVESLIYKDSNFGNFNYFYAQTNPGDSYINITINPNKYPQITSFVGMFMQGSYNMFRKTKGKKFNIQMSNPFIVTTECKSIDTIFDNCGTIQIPDNFIVKPDNTSAFDQINSAGRTFYGCTLNNAISILNNLTELTSAQGMFCNAKINDNISGNHLELNNTKLTNLGGMFYGAKFIYPVEIDSFIKNLVGSTITLDTCFYNCTAYISQDFIINENTNTVTINGFLTDSSGNIIKDSGGNIIPTAIVYNNKFRLKEGGNSSNRVIIPTTYSTSYSSYGPFMNRKTTSTSITLNPSTNKNLAYYLKGVSRNDSSTLDVEITNPNSINGICWDASNVNVTFSTNTSCSAESAFQHCMFDNTQIANQDSISLDNITNASKMFAGSNITKITFVLPSTITNVISMFNQCKRLQSGLPSGFFSNNQNIIDVSKMFYQTRIVVKYEGDTERSDNIELPDQVTKANATFAAVSTTPTTDNSTLVYPIKISNGSLIEMKGIFASSEINNIIIDNIANNSDMSYAFANKISVPSTINLSTLLNKVRTATGMFYNESTNSNNYSKYTIPNNVISDGFFYNWSGWTGPDITIPAIYKKDRFNEVGNTASYSTTYIND